MPAELSLRGERIWLRPIEIGDAVELANASHTEEEVAFTGGRIPLSVMSFERWIEGLDGREHVFAICRMDDDRCIGTASLRRLDMDNGTGETGMGLLHAADRGQGLGPEAKRLLLEYAFTVLGLHVVSCTISSANRRSVRAVERQGYRFAGKLTGISSALGGRFCDQLVYDLTQAEWEAASRQQG
jgi:RimJ/RimL family protein N-acetyltransferase